MYPSACVYSPPGEIGSNWTDAALLLSLEGMVRGNPLPTNVITEVNPYNVLPWDLPDNIWYLFNSEDPKTTGSGYWKVTGCDRRILTNSSTTGSRTTLEFYKGEAPHGSKTLYVMHEYRINQKAKHEMDEAQNSSSLSRVFLNVGQSSTHNEQHNHAGANDANVIDIMLSIMLNAERNNHNSQDSTSRSQARSRGDVRGPLAVSERHLGGQRPDYHVEDINELSEEDFLELLDIPNPESTSSSSENSSCLTMSSDEYFDSDALLRDIEAGNNQGMERKNTDSKFNVSASLRPNQVVFSPASSGSRLGCSRSNLPSEVNLVPDSSLLAFAVERQLLDSKDSRRNVGDANKGPPTKSQNKVASSNSIRAAAAAAPAAAGTDKKNKVVDGSMAKLRKKYCCFMPF